MTLSSALTATLVSICALVALPPLAQAQSPKPTIFVGPQIREGYLDVDAGIRDSIKDIQSALGVKRTPFVPTDRRESATLVLIVVARGIVTNGSVGFSSASTRGGVGSGFGYVVPNTTPTLTTLLRVGSYERVMQSESSTWTDAARKAVDDVLAWWEANGKTVQATGR